MSYSVIGSYVASGDNPSSEVQNMRLDISYDSVSVSNGTATTKVYATLYVKRDRYGPSTRTATAYIACDGYTGPPSLATSSTTQKFTIGSSWVKVHSEYWTINYNPASSKTISLRAGFDMPDNSKLRGLVLPAYNYGYGSGSQEGNLSITFSAQASNCSAPTWINNDTKKSIVEPLSAIYFSWGGDAGGISNPIKEYRVYYREGAAPTASSYDKVETVTSRKDYWTVGIGGEESRGRRIYVGVQAIGSLSGYNSGITTAYLCTINSRPKAPSGSVSKKIVPSTGGQVTFYLNPGTDSDGQNCSLYARRNGGGYYSVGREYTTNITATTNFEFYTYDGLAYSSSALKLSVTKNTKPVISSASYPTTVLKSERMIKSSSGAMMKYVTNPTPSNIKTNKTSVNYKYYIRYGKYDSDAYGSYSDASITPSQLRDVRQKIGVNKWYKIGIVINDGIENSDTYWYPSGSKPSSIWDTNTYCIPPSPLLKEMYNQYDNQNLPGANSDHFYRNIRLIYTYDEGFNQILKVTCSNNQQESLASLHNLIHDSRGYVQDITAPENLISGQRYHFNVTFRNIVNNNETYSITLTTSTLKRVPIISLDKLTIDINTFKPYSNLQLIASIKINKWFSENSIPYSDYSLIEGRCFNFKMDTSSYSDASIKLNNPILSGDYITFSVNHELLYKNLPNTLNKNDINKVYLIFNIVNAFGVRSRRAIELNIDYREPCVVKSSVLLVGSKDFLELNELVKLGKGLKEGMPMFYTGVVQSYNGVPSAQIQIKRSNQNIWQNYGASFELDSGTTTPEPGKPTEYSITKHQIIEKIGELVQKEYTSNFQIIITNKAKVSISKQLYENIKVYGHTTANIVANNITYDVSQDNHTFKSIYSCDDLGVVNTNTILTMQLEYRLVDQEDQWRNIPHNISLDTFLGSYKPVDFVNNEPDKDSWNAVIARFKITTTNSLTLLTETFVTEKITYSNEIIVYNIAPTVSYRKNYLGINIKDLTKFGNDAVLTIGEYTGRDKIYLFSAKTGTKIIDIETGEINNFIIDGGTW